MEFVKMVDQRNLAA